MAAISSSLGLIQSNVFIVPLALWHLSAQNTLEDSAGTAKDFERRSAAWRDSNEASKEHCTAAQGGRGPVCCREVASCAHAKHI
jgi:hypothetical protein